MGFGTAVKTVFSKYATFSGRARRSEFWWWVLFVTIIAFILRFVDYAIGWNMGTSTSTVTINGQTTVSDGPAPFGILSSLWALAVLLPGLAVMVRRLHDSGRSGWWWWLNIICCIGGLILFIFYVMPSQPTENKYGPVPA